MKEDSAIFSGPLVPIITKLSLPIFMGMVGQLFYNITDMIFISRIDLGDPSIIGGVGLVGPFFFLGIALNNGLMTGCSSLVARAIGKKEKEVLYRVADSGLFLSLIVGGLLLITLSLFAEQLVTFLGGEGSYKENGLAYLKGIIPAIFLMQIVGTLSGVIQGEGSMKYIMHSMLISTLGNILLDPIFIFLLGFGVKGAAIATSIAQLLGLLYLLHLFLFKKIRIPIAWKIKHIKLTIMREIIRIGLPQSFSFLIISFSFLCFNKILVFIDPLAMAAVTIVVRLDQLTLMPSLSIGSAIITLVGQNTGRGNFERVGKIVKTGIIMGVIAVSFFAAILVVLAPTIASFFSKNSAVVDYAVGHIRVVEPLWIFASATIISRSLFMGIGNPMPSLLITLLRMIIIALPVMLLLVYVFDAGIWGFWGGLIASNLLTSFISIIWMNHLIKKKIEGAKA